MCKVNCQLSAADHDALVALLKKGQHPAKVFKRATALLELAQGKGFQEVADTLGVSRMSVHTWRSNYQSRGLACLYDQPRSGRPIEIDGDQRAKITALACTQAPAGHGRWNLRLLAEKVVELSYCEHISHTQVRQILKKTN
jgi:transposase